MPCYQMCAVAIMPVASVPCDINVSCCRSELAARGDALGAGFTLTCSALPRPVVTCRDPYGGGFESCRASAATSRGSDAVLTVEYTLLAEHSLLCASVPTCT